MRIAADKAEGRCKKLATKKVSDSSRRLSLSRSTAFGPRLRILKHADPPCLAISPTRATILPGCFLTGFILARRHL